MRRRVSIVSFLAAGLGLRAAAAAAGDVSVQTIGYQLLKGDKFPAYYAHLLGKDFSTAWAQYQKTHPKSAREMFLDAGVQPDANDFAVVTLANAGASDADGIRVEVGAEGYAEPAVQTVTIKAGKTATINLTPAFSDKIYGIAEATPINIYTKVADKDGKTLFEKTRRITLLGKDYLVWGTGDGTDLATSYDLAFGVATFVTPHDSGKQIDKLLSAAAEKASGRALGGYQGDGSHQQAVEDQARAIYNTIYEWGVKYVNAPISYGANDQRIKFPAESLADKSGNCIEGTLLFASAFEALGMRPVVILVPGHAFVGVRLWDDDDTILPIETTMVGTDPYKDAVKTAVKELKQYLSDGTATIVDIAALRQMGVTPAPS